MTESEKEDVNALIESIYAQGIMRYPWPEGSANPLEACWCQCVGNYCINQPQCEKAREALKRLEKSCAK